MFADEGLSRRGGPSPLNRPHTTPGAVHTTVAVVAYPRISNLDEFQPLKNVPGLRLQWVRSPPTGGPAANGLDRAAGLESHRRRPGLAARAGLDQSIAAHAGQGGTVLGVCGGLQMLGEALIDPEGIDGNAPAWACCRWSPCSSLPRPCSAPAQPSGSSRAPGRRSRAWLPAATKSTTARPPSTRHGRQGDVAREVMPGIAWQNPAGNVLGVYLHNGLFEDAAVVARPVWRPGPTLDTVFDGLADGVARHFDLACWTR